MDPKTKIKVNEVRSRPESLPGYSMVMRGIRTREAAEQWGAKYGFATVYWIKAEEKVYGVKQSAQPLAVSQNEQVESNA